MKITNKWLQEKGACVEGVKWFNLQKETDLFKLCKLACDKKDRQLLGWANWVIVRKMEYAHYVSYAVYAAEQVIDIYEKRYPDDKRPRKAIEAAKKCIENPSDENKKAAATAAATAAAYDAAAAAAYAAAYAADAAYAYAAAAAAAMRIKILEYGIRLLKEKGNDNG